jgi:hypothetical protein
VNTLPIRLLVLAAGVVLASGAVAPASAAYLNVNAAECQSTFPPQDNLIHSDFGVSTPATWQFTLAIACALPRSPLTPSATVGQFFVDGDNRNGASTSCTIVSSDYTGVFLGSASFTTSDAHYDQLLSLPATQLTFWAYANMNCQLPPNGNGTLRGVTSLQ